MSQFTSKFTTESELFSFDFNPVLSTGETLSTATCTAVTIQGDDPNPSAILSVLTCHQPWKSNSKGYWRFLTGESLSVGDDLVQLSASNTYTCTGDIPGLTHLRLTNYGSGRSLTGWRL